MSTISNSTSVAPPIRVAVISEPGMAGVKTHVVDILQNIPTEGLEIEYFYSLTRSDSAFHGELQSIQARGIQCREVPMRVELKVLDDLRAFFQLWKLLRKFRPQVLHLHSSKASGLGRLLSRVLFPRPAVIYTPNAMACYRSDFYLKLERMLGWLTDVLIAVSVSEKQDFIRWKIPRAAQATLLTVGVRRVAPQSGVEPPAEWTIGACGRICYQKNSVLFFRTALAMLAKNPELRFRWIGEYGDDDEAAQVRRLLAEAGNLSQITITGWVADPQSEMARLSTFCMFSRYESFGYVTADAMLLGVPVVALPTTGTVDLVNHEETGLLAESREEHIAEALLRVKNDQALREKITVNARAHVSQKHTIEAMTVQMAQIYRDAAAK